MVFLALSALMAAASVYLAGVLYAQRPHTPSRVFLSAFFILIALWLVVSFSHLWFAEPGPGFVTREYRMCLFLVGTALASLFLFALAYLREDELGNRVAVPILLAALAAGSLYLTPLFIRRAEFSDNAFSVEYGPLIPVFYLCCAFFLVGALVMVRRKMRVSAGTERTRAAYLLAGFGVFFLAVLVLNGILPLLVRQDRISDFSYPFVLFPLSLTAYALLRHRLLDVRLAVRKAFSYLLTLLIFGFPYLMAYLLFSHYLRGHTQALAALSLSSLAACTALTPLALRVTSRAASRLFFRGLYDEKELLQAALTLAGSGEDLREGLAEALVLVAGRLGLEKACLLIPAGESREEGNALICCRREGERPRGSWEMRREAFRHLPPGRPLLPGEGSRKDVEGALRDMERLEARAAFPLKGRGGLCGTLLVGDKLEGPGLDPVDVDFLESLAEVLGPLVESHLQSIRLHMKLEEVERLVRELEESDRLQAGLIEATSHRFRDPVTVLYGFAAALKERMGKEMPEGLRDCLECIESSAEKMKRLLDKFLVASRLSGGEEKPAVRACALKEVLDDAVSSIDRGERWRVRVQGDPAKYRLLTDPYYLSLALANLMENALRFSDDSNPVILKVGEGGGGLLLEVVDFGEGFEQEEVARLFAPFSRLEGKGGRESGVGLGLYIVRRCADLLNLEVRAESRPGEGSRFAVLVPRENLLSPPEERILLA